MTKRLPLILFITIAALTLSVSPALAQEDCSETEQAFSIPGSFPLNSDDWIVTPQANGTVTDIQPDGFSVAGTTGVNTGADFLLILPVPATITHVSINVSSGGPGQTLAVVLLCQDIECMDYDAAVNETDDAPFTASSDDTFTDVVAINIGIAPGGDPSSATIEDIEITGVLGACLFRPIHADDIRSELTSGDQYDLITDARVRVYAISDAEVLNIAHYADGYAVGLLINGVNTIYYDRLSSVLADEGSFITGGCVLGYVGDPPPGQGEDEGRFIYEHAPSLGDWHDYEDSLSATPCNQIDSNCINPNPNMDSNGLAWLSRNVPATTVFNPNGDSEMVLPKNSQIFQPGFLVDTDETWYVTVIATPEAPGTHGQLTIDFAGVTSTHQINTFGGEYVTLTSIAISPAETGVAELQLTNTYSGTTRLHITFACLHEGDVLVAPPKCYFEDSSIFDDSFETEGGATFEAGIGGLGQYSIPVGGVIRGPVSLSAFTDADTDYTLQINGAAPDGAAEVTASIVDSDTDDELLAISAYAFDLLFWTPVKHGFTIGESDSLVGDLYIENTGSKTVLIGALCLSSDTGVWPGYENPDYASHDLLPTNCEECAFPETLVDVVAWLNWLGCVFRYLIFCLLYTLVNNIWNTILAVASGIGLFGRWLGIVLATFANYAGSLGTRLLLNAINIAIGVVNTILAWLYAQPFFQGILDAVSLALLWLDAIWSLVQLALDFIVTVFTVISYLLQDISAAYLNFITALSAPATYHIFPDCSDTGAPLYDMCLGFDIMAFFLEQFPMSLVLFGVIVALVIIGQLGRLLELGEEVAGQL